ncbi:FG-GAP-like repeat-containing protein, partial [Marinoscillum furvescens]
MKFTARIVAYLLFSMVLTGELLAQCTNPLDQSVSAQHDTIASGTETFIDILSTEPGVNYYLRENSTNALVNGPLEGTGEAVSFSTGPIDSTTTFNVLATRGDSILFTSQVINSSFPAYGLGSSSFSNGVNLGDVDGDGDLDLMSSSNWINFIYYENTGTAEAPDFAGPVDNPFGITTTENITHRYSRFVDLDGDGDLDMMAGQFKSGGADFNYFENQGDFNTPSFAAPVTNPFGITAPGSNAIRGIDFADLDADGDFDMISGDGDGDINIHLNNGTAATPSFSGISVNGFGLTSLPTTNSFPQFIDLDADGDLDIVAGGADGNWYYFENIGTSNSPSFASYVVNQHGFDPVPSGESSPGFGDLDADGDLDMLSGNDQNDWVFYKNESGVCATVLSQTPTVSAIASIQTAATGNWSSPATWQGGTVPSAGDPVEILHDVTLDVDTARAFGVVLADTATLSLNANVLDIQSHLILDSASTLAYEGGAVLFSGANQLLEQHNTQSHGTIIFAGVGTKTINLFGSTILALDDSLVVDSGAELAFIQSTMLSLNDSAGVNIQGIIGSENKWSLQLSGNQHFISGGDFYDIAVSSSAQVFFEQSLNYDNSFVTGGAGSTVHFSNMEVNLGASWSFDALDSIAFEAGTQLSADSELTFSHQANPLPSMILTTYSDYYLLGVVEFASGETLQLNDGVLSMGNATFNGSGGGLVISGGDFSSNGPDLTFNSGSSLVVNSGFLDITGGDPSAEGTPYYISGDNFQITVNGGSVNFDWGTITGLGGDGLSVTNGEVNVSNTIFSGGTGNSYLTFSTEIGPITFNGLEFSSGPTYNVVIDTGFSASVSFNQYDGAFSGPDFHSPGDMGTIEWLLQQGESQSGPEYAVSLGDFNPVAFESPAYVFLGDDDMSGEILLDFDFDFFKDPVSSVYISSNGFITFDPFSDNGCCEGMNIPNQILPDNYIAGYWTNLNPAGADTIRYEMLGVAPNRIFAVEFLKVRDINESGQHTFQIQLHEGSDIIEIHTTSANISDTTALITQGIENYSGTSGAYYDGRVASHFTLSNDAVVFTPQIVAPTLDHVEQFISEIPMDWIVNGAVWEDNPEFGTNGEQGNARIEPIDGNYLTTPYTPEMEYFEFHYRAAAAIGDTIKLVVETSTENVEYTYLDTLKFVQDSYLKYQYSFDPTFSGHVRLRQVGNTQAAHIDDFGYAVKPSAPGPSNIMEEFNELQELPYSGLYTFGSGDWEINEGAGESATVYSPSYALKLNNSGGSVKLPNVPGEVEISFWYAALGADSVTFDIVKNRESFPFPEPVETITSYNADFKQATVLLEHAGDNVQLELIISGGNSDLVIDDVFFNFGSADTLAPTFDVVYINSVGSDYIETYYALSEEANVYKLITPLGSYAPSVAEVIDPSMYIDPYDFSGVMTGSEAYFYASGLMDSTGYNVYLVAEDMNGNLSDVVPFTDVYTTTGSAGSPSIVYESFDSFEGQTDVIENGGYFFTEMAFVLSNAEVTSDSTLDYYEYGNAVVLADSNSFIQTYWIDNVESFGFSYRVSDTSSNASFEVSLSYDSVDFSNVIFAQTAGDTVYSSHEEYFSEPFSGFIRIRASAVDPADVVIDEFWFSEAMTSQPNPVNYEDFDYFSGEPNVSQTGSFEFTNTSFDLLQTTVTTDSALTYGQSGQSLMLTDSGSYIQTYVFNISNLGFYHRADNPAPVDFEILTGVSLDDLVLENSGSTSSMEYMEFNHSFTEAYSGYVRVRVPGWYEASLLIDDFYTVDAGGQVSNPYVNESFNSISGQNLTSDSVILESGKWKIINGAEENVLFQSDSLALQLYPEGELVSPGIDGTQEFGFSYRAFDSPAYLYVAYSTDSTNFIGLDTLYVDALEYYTYTGYVGVEGPVQVQVLADSFATDPVILDDFYFYEVVSSQPGLSVSVLEVGSYDVSLDVHVSPTSTVYYIVSQDGTIPSAEQIKMGQDGTGSTAESAGSFEAIDGNYTFQIPGEAQLLPSTSYYTFWIAENESTFELSEIVSDTFTTDVAPVEIYIKTINVSDTVLAAGVANQLIHKFEVVIKDGQATMDGFLITPDTINYTFNETDFISFTFWESINQDSLENATNLGSTFFADQDPIIPDGSIGKLFNSTYNDGDTVYWYVTADLSAEAMEGSEIGFTKPEGENNFGIEDPKIIIDQGLDAGAAFSIQAAPVTPKIQFVTESLPAQNLDAGTTDNLIYKMVWAVADGSITTSGLYFTLGGSYNEMDFPDSAFQLSYAVNIDDELVATDLGGANLGNAQELENSLGWSMTDTFNDGDSIYLYLTADIDAGANHDSTFYIEIPTLDNFGIDDPKDKIDMGLAQGSTFTIQNNTEIPVVTVSDLTTNNVSPAVSGTIGDTLSVISLTVDGSSYSAVNLKDGNWEITEGVISALAEGSYTMEVTATNSGGNTATATGLLQVDLTPPVLTINSLTTGNTSPEVVGTVSDTDAFVTVTIEGTKDTVTVANDGSWTIAAGTFGPFTDGTYQILGIAKDGVGNADTTYAELIVDTSLPVVTVDALTTSTPSPSLSGTVDDFQASISVTVAGVSYTAT